MVDSLYLCEFSAVSLLVSSISNLELLSDEEANDANESTVVNVGLIVADVVSRDSPLLDT